MTLQLNEIQPLFRDNPKLRLLLGVPAWDASRILRAEGRFEKALKMANAALNEGDYDEFYEERGKVHVANAEDLLALDNFQRALDLDPQDADVLALKARTLFRLGRFDFAKRAIDDAISLAPGADEYADYLSRWASELVRSGYELYEANEIERAVEVLDRALSFDPNDAEAYYWRGQARIKNNDPDHALVDFRRAIEIDPRRIAAYKSADWVLSRRGEWDTVIALWDDFLTLEPGSAEAHLERAGAHRRRGDQTRALADLERACNLGSEEGCGILARYR